MTPAGMRVREAFTELPRDRDGLGRRNRAAR